MEETKIESKDLGQDGFKVIHYKTIDSTQKEIWRRVKNGTIENKTIVIADIQTSGIGTHGRTWHTDEENNIAFSVYFDLSKSKLNISSLDGLTIKIAENIVGIFYKLYGISLDIKFPNDIYCNGKKLGGILTETKVQDGMVKCLVIGIGINTNQTKFADEIKEIATSVRREFGFEVENRKVISEFFRIGKCPIGTGSFWDISDWGRFLFRKRTVPNTKRRILNENRIFISRSRFTICWNGKRII